VEGLEPWRQGSGSRFQKRNRPGLGQSRQSRDHQPVSRRQRRSFMVLYNLRSLVLGDDRPDRRKPISPVSCSPNEVRSACLAGNRGSSTPCSVRRIERCWTEPLDRPCSSCRIDPFLPTPHPGILPPMPSKRFPPYSSDQTIGNTERAGHDYIPPVEAIANGYASTRGEWPKVKNRCCLLGIEATKPHHSMPGERTYLILVIATRSPPQHQPR
jgi:hypothetical protein